MAMYIYMASASAGLASLEGTHDDALTRKCFQHHWPFVRGIHGGFPSQRDSNAEL